jgi:glycosyltransferase involved in cell wall biosynthesis
VNILAPKISVIMPIFQVEDYIENAVQSVCTQTFDDFEIILVNDGTKDQSIEKAETILKKYNINWNVINQENAGVSSARNTGIKNAIGEFVICIDPDDVIHKDCLARLYEACLNNKTVMSFCNFKYVTNDHLFDFTPVSENIVIYNNSALFDAFLFRKTIVISPAILIKRSFIIEKLLLYDEKMIFSEDVHFIWRLIMAVDKIAFVDAVLYNYFIRKNSTMTASSVEKIYNGYVNFKLLDQNVLYSNQKAFQNYRLVLPRWVIGALNSGCKMLEFKEFKELAYKISYRKYLKKLICFPDVRVKVLVILLFVNLRLFYIVSKNL